MAGAGPASRGLFTASTRPARRLPAAPGRSFARHGRLVREAPDVRRKQVDLGLAKEILVRRHGARAALGDGLDDVGFGTAVQPDIVGKVRRADLLVAGAR